MATRHAAMLLQHIRRLVPERSTGQRTDRELLQRFTRQREEAAFAQLVQRHGPMVLRVCQRILHQAQDAEDVFQATFLVLSRKAAVLPWQESVASWLYQVAYRLALKARTAAARRCTHESRVGERPAADPLAEITLREAQALLDEELSRLPEKYQAPLVLCYLESRTQEEAAKQLGCSLRTLRRRLERGRELLHIRLGRRGLTLAAVFSTTLLAPSALPAVLVDSTIQAVSLLAAGKTGVLSAQVAALAEGMFVSKLKVGAALLLGFSVLVAGAGVVAHQAFSANQRIRQPEEASRPAAKDKGQPIPVLEKHAPTDRYGDPLPPGAVVRLGTLRWRAGSEVDSLTYTSDGKTLVAVLKPGVCLFDTATGKLTKHFPLIGLSIGRMALAPDGKRLLAWTRLEKPGERIRNAVQIWELPDERKTVELDGEHVLWLGWSAEGQPLAVSLGEGNILLRELASGKEKQFQAKDLRLSACAYAAGGRVLAVSDEYNVIHVWDTVTGAKRCTLQAKGRCVSGGLAFSPDGLFLASLTRDNTKGLVQLWDVAMGKEVHTFAAEKEYLYTIVFAPDGKTLAGVSRWDEVRFWDVTTGRERSRTKGGRTFDPAAAFSPDGETLATVEQHSGAIHLWDVASGVQKPQPTGHTNWPHQAAFSPDGRRVATGSMEGTIFIWDSATGQRLAEVRRPYKWVRNYAFSADGQTLFSSWTDDKLYFSDVATGCEQHVVTMDDPDRPDTRQSGMYMFLSDDRRTLIALSYYYPKKQDGPFARELLVTGWDTATRKQLFRRRRGDHAYGIAVSADARLLAASQERNDGQRLKEVLGKGPMRLEDLATGEPLLTLPDLEGQSTPLAFAPDGRLLASTTFAPAPEGGGDRGRAGAQAWTLRLWEVMTATELLALPAVSNSRIAFSPDGRVLALSAPLQEILLWDLKRGQELRRLKGFAADVTSLAFSPDGSRLVSGLSDSTLLVWDVSGVSKARQPSNTGAESVGRAWADLAADAPKAFLARWALAGAPDMAVPLLGDRLKPAQSADATRLRRLLAELDSERFAVREEARKGLEELGDLAAPALRQALREKPALEVSRRIQGLLEKLHGPVTQLELRRALRAVAVLEDIATPEARRLLERLAQGAPEARLTQAAKASLERLARRLP